MMERPDLSRLIEQLSAVPIFIGLDPQSLSDLAHGAVWRELAAEEVVFLEGAESTGLNYLAHGRLKVVKSSVEGREQVLSFLGPGDAFNEVGTFANRPNPATAIAMEASGIWLLRRTALLRLLAEDSRLAQRLIENMADRVIHLVNLVADLSLRTVTGRLARLILEEASEDRVPRPRWRSQAELAARLGTVSDVVQRALRGLVIDGTIEIGRQEILILNRAALEKLSA